MKSSLTRLTAGFFVFVSAYLAFTPTISSQLIGCKYVRWGNNQSPNCSVGACESRHYSCSYYQLINECTCLLNFNDEYEGFLRKEAEEARRIRRG